MTSTVIALALTALLSSAQLPVAQEQVSEIRIQGNYRTPDEEVRRLAGIDVGAPLAADTVTIVLSRLKDSGRFDEVDVRKRWRSLESPGEVVLVILINEHPEPSTGGPGRLVRAMTRPMVLPILDYNDGYGLTYGARFRAYDLLGRETVVSFPLTWGGTRQATAEISRQFSKGPLTYLSSTFSVRQRENPHYETDDLRTLVQVRAERGMGRWLRAGGSGAWTDVDFGSIRDQFTTWGADLTFDTRRDPELPRNAVYVRTGWNQLRFDSGSINRYQTDARGFVALMRGSVLALRVLRSDASVPLPSYEQFLLGGDSTVRGFRPGHDIGDHLLAGSTELRIPLTSLISFARAGVNVFVDSGAAYPDGTRLQDATLRTGIGAGLFMNAAFFKLNAALARGIGSGWRVHVSTGFQF